MEKDKWAHAEEIEAAKKLAHPPEEIFAEVYSLPVVSIEIGETSEECNSEELAGLVNDYMQANPEIFQKIEEEKLDVVARQEKSQQGKTKWILIVGFGFALLGLGVAGYKIIRKHQRSQKDKS